MYMHVLLSILFCTTLRAVCWLSSLLLYTTSCVLINMFVNVTSTTEIHTYYTLFPYPPLFRSFDLLPTLSFSRWMRMALRLPSGSQRGMKKQLRPPGACASTRWASFCGQEKNHLWPVMTYSPPGPPLPTGVARVVFERTSEPPCFSVMPMPISAPVFCGIGWSLPSYWRE